MLSHLEVQNYCFHNHYHSHNNNDNDNDDNNKNHNNSNNNSNLIHISKHIYQSYLFALVAGDLGSIHSEYKTTSGKVVTLGIYSDKENVGESLCVVTSLIPIDFKQCRSYLLLVYFIVFFPIYSELVLLI